MSVTSEPKMVSDGGDKLMSAIGETLQNTSWNDESDFVEFVSDGNVCGFIIFRSLLEHNKWKKSAISDLSVEEKNGTLCLWRSENLCVLQFFRCHGDFGLERQLSKAGAKWNQIQTITIQGQSETVRRLIFKLGSQVTGCLIFIYFHTM